LNLLAVVALGIVQGLTEFFPISSSGHLVLLQNLLGIKEPQVFADVMLHFGSLVALCVFLRREILDLFRGGWAFCRNPKANISSAPVRLLAALALASVPTFLMGALLGDFFESLFGSLRLVGGALLVTGGFLTLTRFAREKTQNFSWHPVLIGVLQGTAIVPGFSRSGLTIGGALLLGWKKEEAARFSFLLSIPAILGATAFQLARVNAGSQPWTLLLVGTAVSAVFGYLALAVLMAVIKRGRFFAFAYYCFGIGLFPSNSFP